MEIVLAYGENPTSEGLENISRRYLEDCREAARVALQAWDEAREIDGGRFEEWSLSDLAAQCRMQSRDQLDPDFSNFMAELHKRISALGRQVGDQSTERPNGNA